VNDILVVDERKVGGRRIIIMIFGRIHPLDFGGIDLTHLSACDVVGTASKRLPT
jgi:hypothetical protein